MACSLPPLLRPPPPAPTPATVAAVTALPAGGLLHSSTDGCWCVTISPRCSTITQVPNVLEADPTVRLHAAVASGDASSVAACLAAGAIADRPVQGVSALFRACKLGHAQCVGPLLETNVDLNWAAASDGSTPLHAAASGRTAGHSKCAAQLLAAGAFACKLDRGLWLPIHTAAHHGNVATVQLLLAAAPQTVLAQHGGGLTSLHQAAFSGRAAAARVLLAAAPEAALMRCVVGFQLTFAPAWNGSCCLMR